jgi:hypothetical protein
VHFERKFLDGMSLARRDFMIHTLDSPDDDRKHLSALLRGISDENLKGLRMKTVRRIVSERRGSAGAAAAASKEETQATIPADRHMP